MTIVSGSRYPDMLRFLVGGAQHIDTIWAHISSMSVTAFENMNSI
jgi:hypothetical protein